MTAAATAQARKSTVCTGWRACGCSLGSMALTHPTHPPTHPLARTPGRTRTHHTHTRARTPPLDMRGPPHTQAHCERSTSEGRCIPRACALHARLTNPLGGRAGLLHHIATPLPPPPPPTADACNPGAGAHSTRRRRTHLHACAQAASWLWPPAGSALASAPASHTLAYPPVCVRATAGPAAAPQRAAARGDCRGCTPRICRAPCMFHTLRTTAAPAHGARAMRLGARCRPRSAQQARMRALS